MARIVAFEAFRGISQLDMLRGAIVCSCGLALIAAGHAFPLL